MIAARMQQRVGAASVFRRAESPRASTAVGDRVPIRQREIGVAGGLLDQRLEHQEISAMPGQEMFAVVFAGLPRGARGAAGEMRVFGGKSWMLARSCHGVMPVRSEPSRSQPKRSATRSGSSSLMADTLRRCRNGDCARASVGHASAALDVRTNPRRFMGNPRALSLSACLLPGSLIAEAGAFTPRAMAAAQKAELKTPRCFQDVILTLQAYWAQQGCAILQPYDEQVGGGHALAGDDFARARAKTVARRVCASRRGGRRMGVTAKIRTGFTSTTNSR